MALLTVQEGQFRLDGKAFRILSGAMHYFRIHPSQWRDSLRKLKACGLNTVETYVPWNLHEPEEGQFCWEGLCDIEGFLRAAREEELFVLLRPGPYICAEWEWGGLPYWLLRRPGLRLRCKNEGYCAAVEEWFSVLFSRIRPFLSGSGGPVLAVQVENEYGSYGDDPEYLSWLEALLHREGVNCLLFTSDGWLRSMQNCGSLPHLLKTANFGSRPEEGIRGLRAVQPQGPDLCGEFWDGWFDHWGGPHSLRDPREVAQDLDRLLGMGASVNLYLFRGGTNFGWMSGANDDEGYAPTTTSYDYGALLDEAGDPTELYYFCREVLARRFGEPPLPVPLPAEKRRYGRVKWGAFAGLPPTRIIRDACPLSMEELGQDYGYVWYRSRVRGPVEQELLQIEGLRDRAQIWWNGTYRGVLYREDSCKALQGTDEILLTLPEGQEAVLDILVENMGRVNYGPHLERERKGILEGVRIGKQYHFGWEMRGYPLKSVPQELVWTAGKPAPPLFCRGEFEVTEPADTYLDCHGLGKGIAFVNGFHLGRYWKLGPTHTLYAPAGLLHHGINELVVFETECSDPVARLVDAPIYVG